MLKIHKISPYFLVFIIPLTLYLAVSCDESNTDSSTDSSLIWIDFTSPSLKSNLIGDPHIRKTAIYLPPGYAVTNKEYPVFYVLHGFGENAFSDNAIQLVKQTLDQMIDDGLVEEMIAVYVDASNRFYGSWYLNSETIGNYEDYISKEMVQYIDLNYRTKSSRESRGIIGFSMGGFGAMHLALKFPGIFSIAVAQSGAYNFNSEWWQNHAREAASNTPENWQEYQNIPWMSKAVYAVSAGTAPDIQAPPFYLNTPYFMQNNTISLDSSVWEAHISSDIVNGDLPRYDLLDERLDAVLIVHGKNDNVIPITQSRTLITSLKEHEIKFNYVEHEGGHEFLTGESLLFLSQHFKAKD